MRSEDIVTFMDLAYQQGYATGFKIGCIQGRSDYEAECEKRYCCYLADDCIIGNLISEDIRHETKVNTVEDIIDSLETMYGMPGIDDATIHILVQSLRNQEDKERC